MTSRAGRRLDQLAWAHTTGRYVALGHDFGIRAMDTALGRYLETLLEPFAVPGEPARVYSLVDRGEGSKRRYALFFDDERLSSTVRPDLTLRVLLWHVNREVVCRSGDRLLLHAAAAERDGVAVLLPAPPESGKTTLVAALVAAGMRYLTDEVVALDPNTLMIEPFPKPLALTRHSRKLLPDFEPRVDDAVGPYLRSDLHVSPRAIRPDAIGGRARPGIIVTPRYEPGATSAMEPLRRSETVLALGRNAFNLDDHGRHGLETLAAVARDASGYRLVMGDLDEACRLILGLLEPG